MAYRDGDLVFARVRGYCAWPARISSCDVSGGAEKHSVVFYGTNEFANIGRKDLWVYNVIHKNKFATAARMKNPQFAKAIEEADNKMVNSENQAGQNESEQNVEENSELLIQEEVIAEDANQEVENEIVESSTKGGNKGIVKKEKKKVQPLRNANQNLQDDENNNIKTFREKIVEDGL